MHSAKKYREKIDKTDKNFHIYFERNYKEKYSNNISCEMRNYGGWMGGGRMEIIQINRFFG